MTTQTFRTDWSGLRDRLDAAFATIEKRTTYEMRSAHLDELARVFEDGIAAALTELSARRATADVTECLDRAEKRLVEFARSVDDGLSQGGAREWERRIWASFAELRDLAAQQAPE